MKTTFAPKALLALVTILGAVPALADAPQPKLDLPVVCSGLTDKGTRLLVAVTVGDDNTSLSMNVTNDGVTVFNMPVTRELLADRDIYESESFENTNNAPSSLYLQVYPDGYAASGTFAEVSYLPVIGATGILTCVTNNL